MPVRGELELFAAGAGRTCSAEQGYAPKVLAITGTNGKTTVTALTGLLVERSRPDAWRSPATSARRCCDTLARRASTHDALPQVWVLELSSFQLDDGRRFEPDAATVLNVTQDHLDWHGDMDAYAAAKARIFGTRACR